MATIKSFSDLQQSKKLAEILPLESADMCYIQDLLAGCKYGEYKPYIGDLIPAYGQDKIRCWSLAALLGLLPKIIEIADNVYELSVYLYGLYYWNVNNGNLLLEVKGDDNLIDACYEMIIKLHELNLL